MARAGLNIQVNPFGIVFNPICLAHSIKRLIDGNEYVESELIYDQDRFHSLDHHGRFSAESAEQSIEKVNVEFLKASANLSATNVLIVTLGSAWAYQHLGTGKIAANCHRIPHQEFEKILVKSDQIVSALGAAINLISGVCESLQVVLTVSPVRHWKDGAIQNQVSKSHLRIACDELSSSFSNCHYFPAYELVIDELRDYRFYADDMLHPSFQTVEFIWEKFQVATMSDSLIDRNTQIEKLRKVTDHQSDSKEHQERLAVAERKIRSILGKD